MNPAACLHCLRPLPQEDHLHGWQYTDPFDGPAYWTCPECAKAHPILFP